MLGRNYNRFKLKCYQFILLSLLFGISLSRTPFAPDDNQFHLTVAFHSSLSHSDIPNKSDYFNDLKTLLKATSKSLFLASKHHFYLKSVTILLPSSWKSEFPELENQATFKTYAEADIQITKNFQGKQYLPYTTRSEVCGKPGKTIHVPLNFTFGLAKKSNVETKAKLLVKELAFYQFGVFDECGYLNNARFTPFYLKNNDVVPTGCTNYELNGEKTGNCTVTSHTGLPGSNCTFIPTQNQQGEASILYQPTWKNAVNFCDTKTHKSEVPTKQNLFCNDKSVWEVIKTNHQSLTSLDPATDVTPTLDFVLASDPEYVVLLDDSSEVKSNGKFDAIGKALRHFFMYDIPDGSSIMLGTMTNTPTLKRDFFKIENEGSRKSLTYILPENVRNDPECDVKAGIRGSIDVKNLDPHQSRRVIIMVIAGKWTLSNAEHLCGELKYSHMRLMIILCQEEEKEQDLSMIETLKALVSCSYGSIFFIPKVTSDNQLMTMERIKSALRASIQPNEPPTENIEIHKKYFKNSLDLELTGEFFIDSSFELSPSTTLLVTYHSGKNVEEVTLKDQNSGLLYDNTKVGKYFKDEAAPSMSYQFEMDRGLWTYYIKLYENSKHLPVLVSVFSKKNSKDVIAVNVWTNANEKINATETPVKIYAEVKLGHRVIVDAEVTAAIYLPDNSVRVIELFDDGSGDPDIAQFDGIYSRYFTDLTSPGLYSFEVAVNGKSTTSLYEEEPIPSEIEKSAHCYEPSYKKTNIGRFERFAVGSSFYVATALNEDEDVYPPNRITDLKIINILPNDNKIVLEWTEPGDDYDQGKVAEYEIRYNLFRNRIKNQFDSSNLFSNLEIKSVEAKKKTTIEIKIEKKNVQYFIAIRSSDESENKSPISNIVTALISSPEIPTVNPPLSNSTEKFQNQNAKTANTITIIGIAAAAILLLVIIVVVWRVTLMRRRKAKNYPKKVVENDSPEYKGKLEKGEDASVRKSLKSDDDEEDNGGFNTSV